MPPINDNLPNISPNFSLQLFMSIKCAAISVNRVTISCNSIIYCNLWLQWSHSKLNFCFLSLNSMIQYEKIPIIGYYIIVLYIIIYSYVKLEYPYPYSISYLLTGQKENICDFSNVFLDQAASIRPRQF